MTPLTLRPLFSWKAPDRRVLRVVFEPEGRWLYALSAKADGHYECGADVRVHTFDLRTHDVLGHTELRQLCACEVKTFPTPLGLWLRDAHGAALRFDRTTSKVTPLYLSPQVPFPFAQLSDKRFVVRRRAGLQLVAPSTGQVVHDLRVRSGRLVGHAVDRRGRWIVTASSGAEAEVFSLSSGRCLWRFRRHTRALSAVALTRDGRSALTSSRAAGEVFHWSLRRGRLIRRLPIEAGVEQLHAHPNGRHVLLLTDAELLAWDLTERTLAHRWPLAAEGALLDRDRIVLTNASRFSVWRVKALAPATPRV